MVGFLCLLALVLSVFLPLNAHAQTTHGLTVAPGVSDVTVDPGGQTDITVSVINRGSGTLELSVDPASYTVTGDEYTPVYEISPGSSTPADWLTITNDTPDRLEPEGDHVVKLAIDVPLDTPAGGYSASLMVETKPITSESTGVIAAHRIAHIVYINVAGDVARDGSVRSDPLAWVIGSNQQMVSFTAKNSGGTNEMARFGLRVHDIFGRELLANDVTRYVLPGTSRVVELQWRPGGVLGLFKVTRSCELAGKPCDISPSWQLYVHPLGAVLAIGLIGLYTGYMIWWQSRKRRGR